MPHPFSEESGLVLAQVHATARGKDAFKELREELELLTGRLTQPEAFELVVAFAIAHRRLLARFVAEERGREGS